MEEELHRSRCEICTAVAEFYLNEAYFCYEHLMSLNLLEIKANI